MRGLFLRNGKLFFDKECTRAVPNSNPAYEVLKNVRIPPHLTDVVVYEQTYEQALGGLIFVGTDAKGRRQYFYGKMHVQRRNAGRDRVFVKVFEVIGRIRAFIDKYIDDRDEKRRDDMQLAVFMLMETSFFIRLGKMRYLKENDTVGLLTLKNKHVVRDGNRALLVRFVGKDKVTHEFTVRAADRLYEPLARLHVESSPEAFLFNRLNEKRIYEFVRRFGIRVKDLRTYGVNYTFLSNFWSNVKSLDPLPPLKRLISTSIAQTAESVGHTPAISRHAYMATTVLELVQDKAILEAIAEKDFDEFLDMVVGYVKNREVA
ncbi:topoisomerase [Squirrelpox virus]|uniref:DNA topoisomerase n=1 Tax=Squirrelpox virus TaxID=240426 RepID=U3UBD1_9POXV|nr:topoisomerase [Squirrelpox virus]CCD83253.1 topoisomerase [Squirrelpox virus]